MYVHFWMGPCGQQMFLMRRRISTLWIMFDQQGQRLMYFTCCQFNVYNIKLSSHRSWEMFSWLMEGEKALFLFIASISWMPCKEVPLHCCCKAKSQHRCQRIFRWSFNPLWMYPVAGEPIVQLCMNIIFCILWLEVEIVTLFDVWCQFHVIDLS